jgi:hypothetical protein
MAQAQASLVKKQEKVKIDEKEIITKTKPEVVEEKNSRKWWIYVLIGLLVILILGAAYYFFK